MTNSTPSRTGVHLTRLAALAAIGLVGAVVIGISVSHLDLLPGDRVPTAGTSPVGDGPPAGDNGTGPDRPPPRASATPASNGRQQRSTSASSLPAPGLPSAKGTVFDDQDPQVANLQPALLAALRRAATDAADDRILFHVNSGWRSAAYQEQLLQDAIAEYGSAKEAARWVATPQTSAHVSGDAVDLGPSNAEGGWASTAPRTGSARSTRTSPGTTSCVPKPSAEGCPAMYADPTQDPRMQQ